MVRILIRTRTEMVRILTRTRTEMVRILTKQNLGSTEQDPGCI